MKTAEFLKKHGLEETDRVAVTWSGRTEKGLLMPQRREETLFIKLDNGYNLGIALEKIEKISKTGSGQLPRQVLAEPVQQDKKLPKVSILHTGGTIASRVDYRTGGVDSSFSDHDMLALYPELKKVAFISSRLLANMWSDDLRFTHITIIAKAVEEEVKKGAQGIIIGMGTDNLAVASAALSFALESCPIPVLLVGSQRSSDRPSTDGAENLLSAAVFITQTDFAGVAICMHHHSQDGVCAILPATKTKKLHTSRRDAFKAVNDTPVALVDVQKRAVEFIKQEYARRGGKLVLKPDFEDRVALFKISINMFPEQFAFYKEHGFKGVMIEGTALGQTPGHVPNKEAEIHKEIFPALRAFIEGGGVAVLTTNCVWGRVNMNVYSKGRDLLKLGVISGDDMLPETAFVKLAWLLKNAPKDKVPELLTTNLRGEISARTEYEEEFVPK